MAAVITKMSHAEWLMSQHAFHMSMWGIKLKDLWGEATKTWVGPSPVSLYGHLALENNMIIVVSFHWLWWSRIPSVI